MKQIITSLFMCLAVINCGGIVADESDDAEDSIQEGAEELSYAPGCHVYVGSWYGGATLWMARGTTRANLHAAWMGDKISSIRLIGGATTRMWIDTNYGGNSWYITSNVPTLHTAAWGNLGDNASSIDCY